MSKRFASGSSTRSVQSAEATMIRTPQQTLMEQLGIADEDLKEQTSSSDSDDDEVQPPFLSRLRTPVAQDETRELKQMLRETQHKLRTAQSSLSESEKNRERRLKIMRKTHQSALAMKQALVQELQDIISEKDECVEKLQLQLDGKETGLTVLQGKGDGLKRLVEQLTRLHKDHSSLQSRSEHMVEEIQQLKTDKEQLQDEISTANSLKFMSPRRPLNPELGQQARELQQKVLKLERERLTALSRAENEKQLQTQIVDLKVQLRTLQEEKENFVKSKAESPMVVTQLRREKAALLKKNLDLQQEKDNIVKTKAESHAKLVAELQREKAALHNRNLELEQHIQSLEKSVLVSQNDCAVIQTKLQSSESKFEEERAALVVTCSELRCELVGCRDQLSVAVVEAEEKGRSQATGALNKLANLQSSVAQAYSSTTAVRSSVYELRDMIAVFNGTIQQDIATASHKICHKLSAISEQNRSLVGKYRREMTLRKKLHNRVVELQGNIRVLGRVRPAIAEDGTGESAEVVVEQDAEDDGLLRVKSRGSWKQFELDKVFGPLSTQAQVFEQVQPLVTSCMDGYNVCMFAFGQTGSGKTFTMEGPLHDPGINQRALIELFTVVDERSGDWDYSIVVSVLEIYNECVRDLLSINYTEKLELKQGPGGVYVPGLTQVRVACLDEVNEVFALGHENRSTGSTWMNIHSSRSHALLCITVMGVSRTTGLQTIGKLNLIDLAGSERLDKSGSDGVRLLEAKHINKSLSALGDVIHSLRSKSQHTPYRNSKLTYLLQDSLSGESKTLMVVQVAPVHKNAGETVCSLNFAQRVRAVELGQARKKTIMPPTL